MRIAITGGTGFIGNHLLKALLANPDHQILSIARREHDTFRETKNFHMCPLDLIRPADTLKHISRFSPECLIHLAAVSTPAAAEERPEEAQTLNVDLTKHLVEFCRPSKVFLVFGSTDLVFDGGRAPDGGYLETSSPAPLSHYAKTKALGEEAVATLFPEAAIARLSLVYGPPVAGLHGTLGWMKEKLSKGQSIDLFRDEWRTPTFVGDVVKGLLAIAAQRKSGIYHLSGSERVSRVTFGETFAEVFGYNEDLIHAVSRNDYPAKPARPEDTSLSSVKTAAELEMKFLNVEQGLRAVKKG